mmetsp:Transcript_15422/g.39012  ORF Transcript_15422/g.39012 Transcript_15422/m.39012 type:complete len:80 (-) Transcript_15422:128-367(-)
MLREVFRVWVMLLPLCAPTVVKKQQRGPSVVVDKDVTEPIQFGFGGRWKHLVDYLPVCVRRLVAVGAPALRRSCLGELQ